MLLLSAALLTASLSLSALLPVICIAASLSALWCCHLHCGIIVCIVVLFCVSLSVVCIAALLSVVASSIVCIAALLSASTSALLLALLSAVLSSAVSLSALLTSALLGWGGESALSCVFVGGEDGVISPQHGRGWQEHTVIRSAILLNSLEEGRVPGGN